MKKVIKKIFVDNSTQEVTKEELDRFKHKLKVVKYAEGDVLINGRDYGEVFLDGLKRHLAEEAKREAKNALMQDRKGKKIGTLKDKV